MRQKEFFSKHLAVYGYRDMNQFRTEGQNDLGDIYYEKCRELDRFDIGVQFLVYGYDSIGAHLFEVDSSGHVSDRRQLGYGVIGSGYHMASASMRRKPLYFSFESTIYRLLEAKFSAETASGVGKTTTVMFQDRNGRGTIGVEAIDKLRSIWEETIKCGDPPEVASISFNISNNSVDAASA
jgi:hypothetical protein